MDKARFIHTEYVAFVLHFSTFSSLTILLVGKVATDVSLG